MVLTGGSKGGSEGQSIGLWKEMEGQTQKKLETEKIGIPETSH